MKSNRTSATSIVSRVLLGLLTIMTGSWGIFALIFSEPHNDIVRSILATAFGVASLATLIALGFRRWHWQALAGYFALFSLLLIWWSNIKPSNERDWQIDVAMLPYATIEGDLITVHNIRNFDYRSETDYTPSYYDKRFDLSKLEAVDMVASYWMGPAIAHIFLSFSFADDNYLAISIETRKEKGEDYSSIRGFFRQYELIYVVADERDIIRLRTNYRENPPEDTYIYRISGSIENGRRLFLEYIHRINKLNAKPEFYNTLTTNCTTSIWLNTRVNQTHPPFNWRILASGYLPELLYERGKLKTDGLTFPELQQLSHINARAQAADDTVDFSRLIRAKDINLTPTTIP
ncbi:DUF4105 domain-containing protein [Nitrosomonas sp. Is37]|uniref:Lnb N-terminal periplasmic domain-containing protein n=1 Tax=Nitrosomonas sp. Is37 TaxID=3080535 RepID=UPI00294B2EE3|nr:DUF4105 domain-containing protein [Nitrosomonas sp. Is37]MDV6343925.1 DUF4105 domain-containing protein [Nitrosomonas sp. Is37]